MLPTSPRATGGAAARSNASRWKYFRRLIMFKHMDLELALYQMVYLFVDPRKVYKSFEYRSGTKHQWSRDDPAFLVLLAAWLLVSSIAFALVFGLSFAKFLGLLSWVIFIDCIAVGLAIAVLLRFIGNRFLKKSRDEEDIELGYAFDVHCNAFFPLLIILHMVQLIMIKFIAQPWFTSTLVANSLWLVATTYYLYITFLGYSALPFLHNTVVLLYPIIGLAAVWLMATLVQWNISLSVFHFYGLH